MPSIDKKEAITEVLIKDNGVVVIGGIFTIDKQRSVEGIPLLNKIPLLGWLFKRDTKSDQRKDLLIFISPKIVYGSGTRGSRSIRCHSSSGCPSRHEEGIFFSEIESWPDPCGLIGEGLIESDRG